MLNPDSTSKSQSSLTEYHSRSDWYLPFFMPIHKIMMHMTLPNILGIKEQFHWIACKGPGINWYHSVSGISGDKFSRPLPVFSFNEIVVDCYSHGPQFFIASCDLLANEKIATMTQARTSEILEHLDLPSSCWSPEPWVHQHVKKPGPAYGGKRCRTQLSVCQTANWPPDVWGKPTQNLPTSQPIYQLPTGTWVCPAEVSWA